MHTVFRYAFAAATAVAALLPATPALAAPAAATPAAANPAAANPAAATPLPGVLSGTGHLKVRPRYVVVSGDGGFYFTRVHWTRLTSRSGSATAVEHTNPCLPDCASSPVTTRRVHLRFAGVTGTDDGPVFTRLRDHGIWYDLPSRRDEAG